MENKQKVAITESSSGIAQHEDAVLKASMQFFAEEILPYFNIKGKVVSFGPTEIVQLELHKQFQILFHKYIFLLKLKDYNKHHLF